MLVNNKILLNGRAYDWGSIIIQIKGIPVIGVSAISFSEVQNTQNLYGTGLYPVHTAFGKIVPSASITLQSEEIFALQNIARDGILQNIPKFDIIISYMVFNYFGTVISELNSFDSAKSMEDAFIQDNNLPRTIVLKNCRFVSNGQSINQGDMSISYTYDLNLTHIIWDFNDYVQSLQAVI